MEHEKRCHPRFNPEGLVASITINPPSLIEQIVIDGTIVDMSYSGIKIKLSKTIKEDISGSEVQISFTIPESGIPVAIHGLLRHQNEDSELGLEYSGQHQEDKVDDLMFECIKISAQHIQRVVIPIPLANETHIDETSKDMRI